ncbi:MAG TPA: diaminopimelate epimerase [Bacteroidia bacterium]|nr:diaminopimelate epimerase [Bacteroidia bacterium]
MKNLHFIKYHGTGNDFIMVDNREQKIVFQSPEQIEKLCDRRFGIGGDGLILLENSESLDFKMIYYNADGREGSMCGNGGRCTVAFASELGIIKNTCRFEAVDGIHEAVITDKNEGTCMVSLKMNDVFKIEKNGADYILDTGSPHYVSFKENISKMDVFKEGQAIRYNHRFKEHGINVNFIEEDRGKLNIRTYERGVEEETWSCGTGSVAAALVMELEGKAVPNKPIEISTRGGSLFVRFQHQGEGFSDIWLTGPAVNVFNGTIETH